MTKFAEINSSLINRVEWGEKSLNANNGIRIFTMKTTHIAVNLISMTLSPYCTLYYTGKFIKFYSL